VLKDTHDHSCYQLLLLSTFRGISALNDRLAPPRPGLTDQRDAAIALGRLPAAAENYKKTKQPFFIGLGFHKPHLRCGTSGLGHIVALYHHSSSLYQNN
jgi:hypothetical protein